MASAHGARTGAIWGSQYLLDQQPKVLGELATGYDKSQQQLGQAGDLYAGMAAAGQPGLDRRNLLTLGDPSAVSAAVQADPRFAANYDPGMQALLRAHSAAGNLNSGNTDTDAMKFAANLGNATYGQMLSDLDPYLSMYQQGIGGQAGVLGTQAAGTTDYFGNRASVLDNTTKSIVGLGTDALKAGDQAKSQNQANLINGITGGVKLFTSLFGGA
jgi:hypothetical protein